MLIVIVIIRALVIIVGIAITSDTSVGIWAHVCMTPTMYTMWGERERETKT